MRAVAQRVFLEGPVELGAQPAALVHRADDDPVDVAKPLESILQPSVVRAAVGRPGGEADQQPGERAVVIDDPTPVRLGNEHGE